MDAPPERSYVKVTVDRKLLVGEMVNAARFLPDRADVFAQMLLMLTADPAGLRLYVDNGAATFSTIITADVLSPGTVLVQGKALARLLCLLSVEALTLEQIGERLEVTAPGVKLSIFASESNLFKWPEWSRTETIGISTSDLCRLLSEAVRYAATDDSRYGLNGVNLEMQDDSDPTPGALMAAATDGHRLLVARSTEKMPTSLPASMLVPRSQIPAILGALKGVKEVGKLTACWSVVTEKTGGKGKEEKTVTREVVTAFRLEAGGRCITCRLETGDFPDWRQVVPESHNREVVVDYAAFMRALRAAGSAASGVRGLRMQLSPSALEICLSTANADTGIDLTQVLPVLMTGDALTIGVKVDYLREALRDVKEASVVMRFNGPERPILVPIGSDLHVIMPMRTE